MRYVKLTDGGGKQLAIYPISLASLSHTPSDADYFQVARDLAVKSQLVTLTEAVTLRMSFVERPAIWGARRERADTIDTYHSSGTSGAWETKPPYKGIQTGAGGSRQRADELARSMRHRKNAGEPPPS